MSKSRAYCFTLNNPTDAHKQSLSAIKCTYIIVGLEHGEEKKTPHLQGYLRFKSPIVFKSVKKKLPNGCHIEAAKGSPQQNIIYCSKESIFYENGTRPKMGKRTDIEKVKQIINDNGSMSDVIDSTNSYQAMRCAELILKYKEKPRSIKPHVVWLYGPTGTGKSKLAFESSTDPWVSGKNLKWWEGYDAHKHVIFDDFRADFCTFHELLRILDRYPYRIENKGGSRQLLATQIFITSPYHPKNIYNKSDEDVKQLLRRIDDIKQLGDPLAKDLFLQGSLVTSKKGPEESKVMKSNNSFDSDEDDNYLF